MSESPSLIVANPVRLRQFGVERVDFLGTDVSGEERETVGGEAAPLSNHVAKRQGHAIQREKSF